MNSAKLRAKGRNPLSVASRSSKLFGTSSETTRSVRAKAKTASLNLSSRETAPAKLHPLGLASLRRR
jgi:hypothetical protein